MPHERTNASVAELLRGLGYNLNPMSGVRGSYYTTERRRDLLALIHEMLKDQQ